MKGRFNKSGSTVSFFAFQDVITGTTGFLIIITIFLALNLDEVIVTAGEADASASQVEALNKMLAEIVTLKNQVAGVPAPGEDAASIIRMIKEIKRSIDRLSPPTNTPKTSPEEAALSREVRFEKQKLLTKLEAQKNFLPETTKNAAKAESKVASSESEIKNAKNRLQQTLDRKNVLKLIPERSATNKGPIVVVVKKNSILLQFFDGSESKLLGSFSEFTGALRSYPSTSHYLVFYFKPSGAAHFNDFTRDMRKEGYEIGYDVIPELTEFETAAQQ